MEQVTLTHKLIRPTETKQLKLNRPTETFKLLKPNQTRTRQRQTQST